MDSVQYGYLKKYLDACIRFAKTVVVAYPQAALAINRDLVATYGSNSVDELRPETWKYYLNLAGRYHPTDTVMTVISIDTLEEIEFSRDNLAIHTGTAKAYAYGTRYYNALLLRYPDQQLLIDGILVPADLEAAVAAPAGTILAYEPGLIEANEATLIRELESWLQIQIGRWDVAPFAISDELYPAAFFAMLHYQIPPRLMNLRLKRTKTHEVHSFHVRMYLASHMGLDRYLPYLTQKQALWLYRNIAYLERNFGKTGQFYEIVERLLTERGIPLGEYTVRQLDEFDEFYRPKVVARIKPINNRTNEGYADSHSLDILYHKETSLADGNASYLQSNLDADLGRFQTANSGVTRTKALRSSMIDYSNATPVTFEAIALREWCYLANNGMYEVMVAFQDPKTSTNYSLFAKDAFIYFCYITLRKHGVEVMEVPEYLNFQYRLHPKPTVDELLAVIPHQETKLVDLAQEILKRQPDLMPVYSASGFFDLAFKLYRETYWHWLLISSMKDAYERGMVENMVYRLYGDELVTFDTETPYMGTWLTLKNLPVYDYTPEQSDALTKALYEAATGLTVDDTRVLRNIQKNLIDLLTEMSSYSIQIIREINESDVVLDELIPLRGENLRMSQENLYRESVVTSELEARGEGKDAAHSPLDFKDTANAYTIESDRTLHAALPITVSQSSGLDLFQHEALPKVTTGVQSEGPYAELEVESGLPGYAVFLHMSEAERSRIKYKL